MLPQVFAIYRREEETFQLIQTESDKAGEIQRLKGWRPPLEEGDVGANPSWDLGVEWYVEPTAYKGTEPILHNCILHNKAYKWWSVHHKLVWSNHEQYAYRENESQSWAACPSIPILEFNNKHVYPREYVAVEACWASAMPQDLEEELNRARHTYLTDTHKHVDPSELRIQTPKEKPRTSYKRRSVSPMPAETDSDLDAHEWDSEFTPGAPKHRRLNTKHLNYMYETEDEMDAACPAYMALFLLLGCILGTYGMIGLHIMGN